MSNIELVDFIEDIYGFDKIEELLQWFFPRLAQALPIRAACYIPFKQGTYIFQEEGSVGYHFSQEQTQRFFKEYLHQVPLYSVPAMIKTMIPNKGIRVNKMLPHVLYKDMPVYMEFFAPMGIYWVMPSLLACKGMALGGLALHRSKATSFSKDDKLFYDKLAPHLARAIYLCQPSVERSAEADAWQNVLHDFKLSRRQLEVVEQVMLGLSNREIANRLSITEQTVKDHLYTIYQKVSVKSRSQLISKLSKRS